MTFLTKQEKYIISFLIAGALCGVGYSYYRKFHPPLDIRFRKSVLEDESLQKELDRLLEQEKSVNINSASFEELVKLKGIGPVLANNILEYRRKNGAFRSKEELQKVPGIGPGKFEAIKDRILLE